ncbi:hypothetical protein WJX73_001718 [Symbiochloris irregularis]|uniref:Uncharacterized protein n=1 Tax=Symbiochloris irregularis TaxID=706552 RepID=A0AAW1P826_9CHLO
MDAAQLRQRKPADNSNAGIDQRTNSADVPSSEIRQSFEPSSGLRLRFREFWAAYLRNRRAVGWVSLCCGLVAAVLAWPTLMAYEDSWHKPAARFATSLTIASGVSVSAGLSPSLSPYKGSTFNWFKLGGVWLILGNVYVAFGMLGPDGALCIASLLLATVSLR